MDPNPVSTEVDSMNDVQIKESLSEELSRTSSVSQGLEVPFLRPRSAKDDGQHKQNKKNNDETQSNGDKLQHSISRTFGDFISAPKDYKWNGSLAVNNGSMQDETKWVRFEVMCYFECIFHSL